MEYVLEREFPKKTLANMGQTHQFHVDVLSYGLSSAKSHLSSQGHNASPEHPPMGPGSDKNIGPQSPADDNPHLEMTLEPATCH